MSAMTKKRFLDMLRRVKDWYAVRKGRQAGLGRFYAT